MSGIDRIIAELHASLSGLSTASSASSAALTGAGRVRTNASRTGLGAVAAGIARIQDRLRLVLNSNALLVSDMKAILAVVKTARDERSSAGIVATLAPTAPKISAARDRVTTVIMELDRVRAQVTAALKGGHPERMMALVEQIKQASEEVLNALDRANEQTSATIAEARKLGDPSVHSPTALIPRAQNVQSRVDVGGRSDASADAERQGWFDGLARRPAIGSGVSYDYQVRFAGPEEVEIPTGQKKTDKRGRIREETVWADGFRVADGAIVDTKHVSNPASTPFRPTAAESGILIMSTVRSATSKFVSSKGIGRLSPIQTTVAAH